MPRRLLPSATLLFALAACHEPERMAGPPPPDDPVRSIADAAHGGGDPRFYFLPPLVPNPGPRRAPLDTSASPEVRICRWSGDACVGEDVATFTRSSTPALMVTGQAFQVNWHTRGLGLQPGEVYRIRVFLGSLELGHADVRVVASGRDKRSVGTDHLALLRDTPLLIRFRIERDADAGGRIAFESFRDGNFEIYAIDADGSNLTRLTDHPAADHSAAWSPDGRRIAFMSFRDGNFEIYVMDADGSNLTRLTHEPAGDFDPAWSPDGTMIAFASLRDGVRDQIYVMDADGSNPTRLTNSDFADIHPDWSPDGTKIVFATTRDGQFHLYVMEADGADPQALTTGDVTDIYPAWAPDGRMIAFTRFLEGNAEIFVVDADGTNPRRLTDHEASDSSPTWSPDGRHIAFTSDRSGQSTIWIMEADGSNPVQLTTENGFGPSWTR